MNFLVNTQNVFDPIKAATSVAALAFLSACPSNSWMRQADAGLRVERVHSNSGSIMSFRTHEASGRLYVTGRAKTHQLRQPAHIDVDLIGADGGLVARRTDKLDTSQHPRTSSGSREHDVYVASFPLSEARQAARIRVVYHESDHSNP